MKNKTLRIIGYCRESTKDQFEGGFNIDDQEKKIRKYADVYFSDQKYTLSIRKEGASAKSLNRTQMNEIIRMAKKKQFDVFIVHNLDRMTRRVRDLASLLDIFQESGIQLISITEKIDTETPMGRFFIYLIVLIAQWEQETISSRTQRGVMESARQGNYCKSAAPYGYIKDPEDKHRLLINEEEAEVVRWLFENRERYKSGSKRLRLEMKEQFPDVSMTSAQIAAIIKNRIYYGTMELKGSLYPDIAPPIIGVDQYLKGQLTIEQKTVTKRYVFQHKVICRTCGCYLTKSEFTQKGHNYRYYRCGVCDRQISEKKLIKAVSPMIDKEKAKQFSRMNDADKRDMVIKYIDYIGFEPKTKALDVHLNSETGYK